MQRASRWTIKTHFADNKRETNLAVLLERLGIEDVGANETGEVQQIIMAVAESVSRKDPCLVEAYHDGNLLLASRDHRSASVAL